MKRAVQHKRSPRRQGSSGGAEGEPFRLSDRTRELLALLVLGATLYLLLAVLTFRLPDPLPGGGVDLGSGSNLGGVVGHSLAHALTFVLGYASWLLLLAAAAFGMCLLVNQKPARIVLKALGILSFAALLAILLAGPEGRAGMSQLAPYGAGGNWGAAVSPALHQAFGGPGRLLLVMLGLVAAAMLGTGWLFSYMLERAAAGAERLWNRARNLRPALATAGAELDGLELDGVEPEGEEDDAEDRERHRSRRRAPWRRGAAAAESAEIGDGGAAVAADPDADEPEDVAAHLQLDDVAPELRQPERAEPDQLDPGGQEPVGSDRGDGEGEDPAQPEADDAGLDPEAAPTAPRRRRKRVRITRRVADQQQAELPFDGEYPFPPVELFQAHHDDELISSDDELHEKSEAIVDRLAQFKVDAEVVGVSVGPAVTQFELRLGVGVRVTKISSFEPDLAAALRAVSVRVVAPIPGKDTVGIEVPNPRRQTVRMRELLERFGRAEEHAIPLYLGKDVAGTPIVEDLARMPHLLIAGTTGSGKSVCINTILLSILMTRTPEQVRLLLIDPKMVELQAYKRVPHLCCEVVTNMKKAAAVLDWAVQEMESRYTLLSQVGVNHIKNYNKLDRDVIEKRLGQPVPDDRAQLSYTVLVIDELADLMASNAKEVEESIQRLAQKSRAVGMHVILATQRPSSDVITGVIKANLPSQIAFKVNRKVDSRVILDANGAEKLLGYGDMLYVPPAGGSMRRAQGTFVSDDELLAVVDFLAERGTRPNFLQDLVQTQTGSARRPQDKDDLYDQAVEVILTQQRGSATLIQRALGVGYTRATRLLEMMEDDGVVGPFVGSKSREVMLTLDEWKERESAIAAELDRLAEEGAEAELVYEEAVDGDEEGEFLTVDAGEAPDPDSAPEDDPEEAEGDAPQDGGQGVDLAAKDTEAEDAEGEDDWDEEGWQSTEDDPDTEDDGEWEVEEEYADDDAEDDGAAEDDSEAEDAGDDGEDDGEWDEEDEEDEEDPEREGSAG